MSLPSTMVLGFGAVPDAKHRRKTYIDNNDFYKINYEYETNWIYGDARHRVFQALNHSGCLNDPPDTSWCRLYVDCTFSSNNLIHTSYHLTNPNDCTFENFNYDTKLHLYFIDEDGRHPWNCPWSCSTETITHFAENTKNINSACNEAIKSNYHIEQLLGQCKDLAALNLELTNYEIAHMISLITLAISSAFVVPLFLEICYCHARKNGVDKSIYIPTKKTVSLPNLLNGIIKNAKNQIETTLNSTDENYTDITNRMNLAVTAVEAFDINNIQSTKFTSIKKIDTSSSIALFEAINSLAATNNELLFIQNERKDKKERLRIILQGSHPKNHLPGKNNPLTLFSQQDIRGDLRHLILTYAGLGTVYSKK
jgi:hypothetical protein